MAKVVVIGYDKMLSALISGAKFRGHEVLGVFRCDRVKYSNFALFFKDIFNPSKDLSFIKSYNLYDIKANSVNSPKFLKEIKRLNPDAILVGSWSEKFGKEILSIPKYGVINCHPSLLPRHRGANPYFWAIYSGDDKTGVTFHSMDENFDTGEILMQASFKIEPYMTGGTLKNKATKVAELMTGDLLDDLDSNRIIPVAQNEDEASYDKYPFEDLDVLKIDESAQKNHDKARGLRPWGYCFVCLNGKVYKIRATKVSEGDFTNFKAGDIIENDPKKKVLKAKFSEGALEIRYF